MIFKTGNSRIKRLPNLILVEWVQPKRKFTEFENTFKIFPIF